MGVCVCVYVCLCVCVCAHMDVSVHVSGWRVGWIMSEGVSMCVCGCGMPGGHFVLCVTWDSGMLK